MIDEELVEQLMKLSLELAEVLVFELCVTDHLGGNTNSLFFEQFSFFCQKILDGAVVLDTSLALDETLFFQAF